MFVDAFEVEECLKVDSEEESRQRQSTERHENLSYGTGGCYRLHPYPLTPIERTRLAEILAPHWGRLQGKRARGARLWLRPTAAGIWLTIRMTQLNPGCSVNPDPRGYADDRPVVPVTEQGDAIGGAARRSG